MCRKPAGRLPFLNFTLYFLASFTKRRPVYCFFDSLLHLFRFFRLFFHLSLQIAIDFPGIIFNSLKCFLSGFTRLGLPSLTGLWALRNRRTCRILVFAAFFIAEYRSARHHHKSEDKTFHSITSLAIDGYCLSSDFSMPVLAIESRMPVSAWTFL